MSDLFGKELDRLLKEAPAEDLSNPLDSVCRFPMEIFGIQFHPLPSDEESKLAKRAGTGADADKAKYREDMFKTGKALARQQQVPEAEKILEKLVIFDQESKCFEGWTAEHLFHLAIVEERQGKLSEAEAHYRMGIEETAEERKNRLMDFAPLTKKQRKLQEGQQEVESESYDNVPRDMHKAENFAALARIARRRGFDDLSQDLLTRAYCKDGSNAKFYKEAADPKNFEQLYCD